MSYIPIDELEIYQKAMEIGEEVWMVVDKWSEFQKSTLGGQFCRAADSIAANISEGHGRFHYKENKNFCFYARGSLMETKTWLKKSHERKMIDDATFDRLSDILFSCHRMLNKYIRSIGHSGNATQEPDVAYADQQVPDIENLPF